MKKINLFCALVAGLVMFSSCQKSSNNDANMNAVCINNPYQCQNGIYSQNYGYSPYYNNGYGYNNAGFGNAFYYTNNSAYLCNCPVGTMPTYNAYGGLGCVNINMMGGFGGYAYFGWNMGATNNQWMNIPQVSNYTGYNQSSCYNGVVQSCIVNQANACSAGYTCRANSASSNIGLCVSNNSINSGGQIYR